MLSWDGKTQFSLGLGEIFGLEDMLAEQAGLTKMLSVSGEHIHFNFFLKYRIKWGV